MNPTHYGQGPSFNRGNESNTLKGDLDENEVGGYNDHDMSAMLDGIFKCEEETMVDGPNMNANAF